MRISIRYKILGVLGFLLLAAVSLYTLLASTIFRQEKVALLYDINHSIAVNTAAQLRASLSQVGDQLRLFVLSHVLGERTELKLPSTYLREAKVIALQLFKKAPKDLIGTDLFVETGVDGALPAVGINQAELLPHLKEADEGNYAFWSTAGGGTPRFFLATKVEIRLGSDIELYVAVAELEGKLLFQTLQSANLFRSYLVKKSGEVLLLCDRDAIKSSPSIAGNPLLKAALTSGTESGVLAFDDQNQSWYGAYAPLGLGQLYFLSEASKDEVTSALETLVKRSILFGLIVITATFIISVLFSKRLTRNLKLLTEGARQIEKGDLDSQIHIKSRDEVHDLATSFNAMVTALKSSREAIEKYNRELEDKVAERTQQLQDTNAAIKEVQEKLLKTTQLAAVGEVAGRTAHEVLNPLTAIISRLERSRASVSTGPSSEPGLPQQLAEILNAWESDYKKGGMPQLSEALQAPSSIHANLTLFEEDLDNLKKLARYWQDQSELVSTDLKFVQDQAQRIHRIIDRMRELVRSSVKDEVSCNDAVKEAADTMADFVHKHGISLEKSLEAKIDLAFLNRDELEQILTNLIRNSFQAIRVRAAKDKTLKGRILVRTSNGHHLMVVDIVDNGIGVPEPMREQIFEQGFTTKGPSEGTGLGLAICRRYARAFSGEVALLFSEPETRGTCFRITIPLKEERLAKAV